MSQPHVAVIGGGLAGLSVAARLRALHVDATVFEAADDVGGVVCSERCPGGWLVEAGPPMAAEPHPDVRAMLDDAGAGAWTIRAGPLGPVRFIVLDGVPVPVPRTTSAFGDSPLLSLSGRLRLLKERFVPTVRVTDESVDSFARRRFGDEVAERVFDPLLASTCGGDPRQIIARYAFPSAVGHELRGSSGLQASARERMLARRRSGSAPAGSWSCDEGMHRLPRQLAAWIGDVRLGARVRRVALSGGKCRVDCDGAAPIEFDAAVLAIPAPAFADLDVALGQPHRLEQLATMPHASIAAVSLGFAQAQIRRPIAGSRLLVPSHEQRTILSMVFPSEVFPGRAPDGHTLITTYVGGFRHADVARDTPEELYRLVMAELRTLLGVDGEPALSRCTRWPDALPQAVAGHAQRLAAADAVEAATPAIAFAGSWRDGLSVAEVLLGGTRAAERLAGRMGWVERRPLH